MINRNILVEYINNLLECDKFKDYAPNGLQVEGRENIHKICTSVSAGEIIVKRAIDAESDMLLVHHGYFWRGESLKILGAKKRRLSLLLQNNLNLCAYHLPLDAHLELGNNACIAEILALSKVMSHDVQGTKDILWTGEFEKKISIPDLSQLLAKHFQKPVHLAGESEQIKKIAWCSGGAQDFIEDAALLEVDAFISGEVSERTFYQAQELGVHYFACGHHATERFGIQKLGHHLAEKFNLEHCFLDINNPI